MTLIPLSTHTIKLPELVLFDKKVGKNHVKRIAVKEQLLIIDLYSSDFDGWYELRSEMPLPYNRIYLRKPGTRKTVPKDRLCIKLSKNKDIKDLDENDKLCWIQHPVEKDLTPEDIAYSWNGIFQFREDKPEIEQRGLRKPQLGALHAVSAYFSVKSDLEPATVVLPTGTGKTETMLSIMIYKQLSKVLVLVPSKTLRKQIADKFTSLGELANLSIIPHLTNYPAVSEVKKGIKSIREAQKLLEYGNVFVATAYIFNHSDTEAIDYFCNGLTDLFIDEAHYSPALTWKKVRERFKTKRIIQFTATPFRNDGSELGGQIVYNYSMSEAQKAGYFRHIDLITIEKYFQGEEDQAIASAAIEKLKNDLDKGYDHILMARVEKKSRSNDVLKVYKELAPEYNPIVIHSDLNGSEIETALSYLYNRESRIVICVKMLGEGFDFPNLKIAAIHDYHKSLAITLQFIGRFTRNSHKVNDASVVVNIAEPEVEDGLQFLYSQGADWDNVLSRLSEDRIERVVKLEQVVTQLKQNGDLHEQVSLWNLRPSCSAILYKTSCSRWYPETFKEIIPHNTDYWYSLSEQDKLLVVLALYKAPVNWGKYKDINDIVFKLLIVHWDVDRSALFINANDYRWFRIEKLTNLICAEQCELLSGPQIFNLFNGMQYPLVRNLGASQIGAISFAQYFGSNVAEGLSRIESSQSQLNNLAGLGYDNGDKVIWGCSQKKGKIWSVISGTIPEWIEWIEKAWDKITSGEIDEANITRDFLRPERLNAIYDEHAISVQWGEYIQSKPEDKVSVLFGENSTPLYLTDIKIIKQGFDNSYEIELSSGELKSIYKFTIDKSLSGGFSYQNIEGLSISIQRDNNPPRPLEEYLKEDPLFIQYVDGSYSYSCFLIRIPLTVGQLNSDQIESLDWSGIDISKESMGKVCDKATIQWKSYEYIYKEYDVILNDDGKGEAADLIGLKIKEDEIHLGLIHCKYSVTPKPSARIDNLYEVCGQAQKSIRWKHSGIPLLFAHIKGREKKWKAEGYTRFLKGTMEDLGNIKRRSRTAKLVLNVTIVQPGLEKDNISEDMLKLLGTTEEYLKKTAQAKLYIIGS